ncbi:chemotaxis protein CheA [Hoeflea prorocentri]|uniref:Chemotaxis protein CheA n=1 Tax=Hoeflea prorocentri TaxID=1922333 RepID=A0A9X3UKP3_9HYPH|nr:chemotaxis protein CheA [Hoeflea prorocentri]MCY6382419.1 chemotaxis protein CheA [Hoeflea prorocentri]MDA5400219.1 chemotaxis protein CheA [Hoeflea prorocentri]
MDMNEIKEIFFQECEEQLAELETGLLALNDGDQDPETVNAVFRAVHSIKGGAGAFALDELVAFAHVFETTLDCVRSNQLEATRDVVKVLLKSADVLADLTNAARDGGSVEEARCSELVAELEALARGEVPVSAAPAEEASAQEAPAEAEPADHDEAGFTPVPVQLDELDEEDGADAEPEFEPVPFSFDDFGAEGEEAASGFKIHFKPKPDLYHKGNETLLLLRELGQLGTLDVDCDMSALPAIDEMDPEGSYLVWNATLSTSENEEAVRAVFEFAEWDCDLEITPLEAVSAEPPAAEPMEEPVSDPVDAPIAENDPAPEISEPVEVEPAIEPIAEQPDAANVIDLQQAAAQGKDAADVSAQKTQARSTAPAAQATIRVELGRIDRLINLVGELVINQAMLAQSVAESATSGSSAVTMGLEDLQQLTREIQDSVMAIRAQPVKPIFQRMSRTVREAAEMVGKNVRLVTEGEATEVDKTVIDKLAEPLTHMIRNAVDHGLESPEDRVAAGKSPEGVVKLSAKHRSGRIVLEISDDGAGINRERVRQKAIDNGIITAETALTDEEVDNLIFQPGFSTAEQLSDISGRGVGMDVVKRSIQALGGRVGIVSTPGKGSVFTMSLPLTLAVLDGMVVTVGEQTLVVPLTSIIETLKPESEHIHGFGASGQLISIRDSFKPLVDVGQILNFSNTPTDPLAGVALLVDSEDGGQSALLVDAIQGQRQVVIKSLEANYANVPGIAAATILGDGQVALIVDVEAVVAASRNGALKSETSLAAVG